MYKVKLATANEFEWMVDVATKAMLEEELGKPQYYDPETIEVLVEKGIVEGTIWLAFKDDEPVGMLGALASLNVFNKNLTCLTEVLWWVHKEHRKSRAGTLLLASFMEAAEHYDEATMSLLVGSQVRSEALTNRGYLMLETIYVRSK